METTQTNMQSIKEEAIAIFKTIILTKQIYGMNYLIKIVRGDKRFELKKTEHETLETFGILPQMPDYRLKNIITWLLKNHYLCMTDLKYGSLGLTAKAYIVMHSEEDLLVSKKDLQTNAENRVMSDSLKRIRKAIAENEGKPIFTIFTDWDLQNLLDNKPKDIASLKNMNILNEAHLQSYGHLIIKAIADAKTESIRQLQEDLARRVKTLAYQTVKDLFLAGCELEQIAEMRQIEKDTVFRYLTDMHRVGELDLRPWIEKQIDTTILQKIQAFFAQEQVTFKDAYYQLGYDYQTLLLGKLYSNEAASIA